MSHTPIVQQLVDYLQANPKVQNQFEQSFQLALSTGLQEFTDYNIKTLDDYINYMDVYVNWIPTETVTGRNVVQHICLFYFILDLPPVNQQQSPIDPSVTPPYRWLSEWLIQYAQVMGTWMDTPASITDASVATFYSAPSYHMDDYPVPTGGWKTFNEFFARFIDPNVRPIAPDTDTSVVVVSPADCTYDGVWPINEDTADVTTFDVKGVPWSISQLLADTTYGPRFAGGQFTHSFLGPNDYHRQHAPVAGTVVEAKIIPGVCYLEVVLETTPDGTPRLKMHRNMRRTADGRVRAANVKAVNATQDLDAPDSPGYQFIQTRGCFIIDNPDLGLVAVLPIGMAQVSSVVPSIKKGDVIKKGQEISCFQFGGSDIVMVFQKDAKVVIDQTEGVHYNFGTQVATAPKKQW